ncbi:hypothetical protein F503_08841 [Ophiostoma piceae UAMH 11346]|uniref:Uncharacterized protein n=1 Tax=Ophiostoma piceae (strain UAMH 11346) TaxID=1262450 RepID=S3BNZ0_OPHP1|nr:hypothetical protein F503_08841 [Ophiostoma piceae UAMH 11346]
MRLDRYEAMRQRCSKQQQQQQAKRNQHGDGAADNACITQRNARRQLAAGLAAIDADWWRFEWSTARVAFTCAWRSAVVVGGVAVCRSMDLDRS